MDACLALDIGGTKMAAGIVTSDGTLLAHVQTLTPKGPENDANKLFEALASVTVEVISGRAARTNTDAAHTDHADADTDAPNLIVCGVGCGGPMSEGGEEVSPLNIPAWVSFPLRSRLQELTGLPVTVDNDAKALALGEGWVGAARGRRNFMAMVVSTGVGGGIVLDGRLLDGRLGNAGHIGHVIVEPDGRKCPCGSWGCLEAEASGRAIAEITGKPPADATPDVVERTGRLVGRAVASVSNLLDLDLTVIAGSVALGFGAPFFEAASMELSQRAKLDFSMDSKVVPAGLGYSGPLIGAGAVGFRALREGRAGVAAK